MTDSADTIVVPWEEWAAPVGCPAGRLYLAKRRPSNFLQGTAAARHVGGGCFSTRSSACAGGRVASDRPARRGHRPRPPADHWTGQGAPPTARHALARPRRSVRFPDARTVPVVAGPGRHRLPQRFLRAGLERVLVEDLTALTLLHRDRTMRYSRLRWPSTTPAALIEGTDSDSG